MWNEPELEEEEEEEERRDFGDGVVSGERWSVLVEEEDGKLKVISTFKARPSIGEVENVLYNLMAMNSPVTKSVKFLKGLVSNVTGKKEQ